MKNLIMKNKRGKGGGATLVILVSIIAILVIGGGLGIWYFVSQSAVDDTGKTTGTGCQIAPSVNVLATNTLVSGTTPTVSANYSIYGGSYVGSIPTNMASKKSLNVLGTATGYFNTQGSIASLDCGANDLKLDFTPNATLAYTIYDSQFNTLTDDIAGGAVNQSNSANMITLQAKISGTPDKSTGKMLLVVEVANKTQVISSGINVPGGERVDTPNLYGISATTSSTASFLLPAIYDGGSKTYDITLSPETGMTIGTVGVYTTLYQLEDVVLDTNTGKFLTEKTWQDSLGADKTKNNVDYDIYIA
jgi:hypothetical protein